MAEFAAELEYLTDYLPQNPPTHRTVSIATGKAAAPTLRLLSEMLTARVSWLSVQVFEIENNFFGPEITVAGLLTGKDMAEQLQGKALGDALLISENTLRAERDLFLCGMTPQELSAQLSVPLQTVKNDGAALLAALRCRIV